MEIKTTSGESTCGKAIDGSPCDCTLMVGMLPFSVWTVLGRTRFPGTLRTTCLRIRRSDLTAGSIRENLIREFVASLDRRHLNQIGTWAWNRAQTCQCVGLTWSYVQCIENTVSVRFTHCSKILCTRVYSGASFYMSSSHPAFANHTGWYGADV